MVVGPAVAYPFQNSTMPHVLGIQLCAGIRHISTGQRIGLKRGRRGPRFALGLREFLVVVVLQANSSVKARGYIAQKLGTPFETHLIAVRSVGVRIWKYRQRVQLFRAKGVAATRRGAA